MYITDNVDIPFLVRPRQFICGVFFRNLTRMPFLKTVEWSKWHVFWSEENVVSSKSHPDSLYSQAKESFFSKVVIVIPFTTLTLKFYLSQTMHHVSGIRKWRRRVRVDLALLVRKANLNWVDEICGFTMHMIIIFKLNFNLPLKILFNLLIVTI